MNRDTMPRNYKPKPGEKTYTKYSDEVIESALKAIEKGLTYRKAIQYSQKYVGKTL